MNGRARSSSDLINGWPGEGVRGKMKLSVTVYKSANVPKVATTFSNTYKGRILRNYTISKRQLHISCICLFSDGE